MSRHRQTILVVLVLLATTALVVSGRGVRSRLGELERRVVTELGARGLAMSVAPRLGITVTGGVRLRGLEGEWRASWGTARLVLEEVRLGTRGPSTPILGADVDELHVNGGHLTITLHDGRIESGAPKERAAVERPSDGDKTETPPGAPQGETDAPAAGGTRLSLGLLSMNNSTLRVIGTGSEDLLATGLELELDGLAWGGSTADGIGLSWDHGHYRAQHIQTGAREWSQSLTGDIRFDPARGRLELTRAGDTQSGTPSVTVGFATEGADILYDLALDDASFDVGGWLGAEPASDNTEPADDGPVFSLLPRPSGMDVVAGGTEAPVNGRFGPGRIRFSGSSTAPSVAGLNGGGTVSVATGTMGAMPLSREIESRIVSLPLVGRPYETVNVGFSISDGVVAIRPFAVMVEGGSLCVEGTVELASGQLNLATRLRFARDLFSATGRTGSALTALTDADGVTVVPLRMQGTWADPEIEIGLEADEITALFETGDDERRSRLLFQTFPSCPST
ncbi:MAG: AsmA-like C-terminal region-containing protein [Acidobacteriota bacterium]|nr:AsmA-like C-terminal region-containing protein [Acidobacteriota bacterium]